MMHNLITPVILTYNEHANIGRTLARLSWAEDVVVVDSGSTDDTGSIAKSFANVRFFIRPFDAHAKQWNYAIKETAIKTGWILALDADYLMETSLVEEIKALQIDPSISAYAVDFYYAVWGTVLPGTAYPAIAVLFDNACSRYVQDGHTQRLTTDRKTVLLKSKIIHDDRKSMSQWVEAQKRYTILECDKIGAASYVKLSMPDRIRKTMLFAPFLIFFYCYIVKGAWRKGWKGLFYAGQRLLVELMLALFLIEKKISKEKTV